MTNVLITGISGFIGQHLYHHLASQKITVFGLDMHGLTKNRIIKGSITDRTSLLHVLEESKPDVVFHLAGILKSVEMDAFYNINVLGTAILLDTIMEMGLRPHVVIAGSSAVYGAGIGRTPITESFTPRPVTHYAASKLAQEITALRYHTCYGLPVTCVRTFNLLGPGLSPVLAPSAFAKQIAQAERRGEPGILHTGDLTARRDYVDVRDAVQAYSLIAHRGVPGHIYNVCSERAVSLEECLQILIEQAKVKVKRIYDPDREQKGDVPVQVGSAKKIRRDLGWQARIPITRSLSDLLRDWREKMKQETINELDK